MKTYLIDIYRDGSEWNGFANAETLDAARRYVLDRFPNAEQFGAPTEPYHQSEADEKGQAVCVENWGIDSTDYADIYEITTDPFELIYDGTPLDGVEPSGQKFAWHDFLVRKQGSDDEARLCVCITDTGEDEIHLGTGDGGSWPDDWDKAEMDAFDGEALATAREKTDWDSITKEIE